jgi:hypothetical protein
LTVASVVTREPTAISERSTSERVLHVTKPRRTEPVRRIREHLNPRAASIEPDRDASVVELDGEALHLA